MTLPKKKQRKAKKSSKYLLLTSLEKWWSLLMTWPSARHFKVMVTCKRVTVTSFKWRADGQSLKESYIIKNIQSKSNCISINLVYQKNAIIKNCYKVKNFFKIMLDVPIAELWNLKFTWSPIYFSKIFHPVQPY